MMHTGITSGCATCHETGKSFSGVTIVTRPTRRSEPPATGDCSGCHSSTTSFTTGVSGGKPANHIPTTAACTLCHTNPASYKPGAMNHTGITSGCTTCHAASVTGTPFYGVTPKPQGTGHIPTTADCATLSQVHHRVRSGNADGAHRHHHRLRDLPRHRQELHRGDDQDAPANHIPIRRARARPATPPTNFTTFAGTAMNHSRYRLRVYDLPRRVADRHDRSPG